MSSVRVVDPEELGRAAAALDRHQRATAGVVGSARRDLDGVWSEGRDIVAGLRRAVAAALAAAAAAGDGDKESARRRLEELRERQRHAEEALRRIERVSDTTLAELERLQRATVELADAGRATLTRFTGDLAKTAAAFAATVPDRAISVAPPPPAPAPGPIEIGTGSVGLVPLAQIDDSDSPVDSPSAFTKVSLPDVRVGLARLEDVVLPAVRSGRDRAHFERLDRERGHTGDASYARVFDAYFGSGAITLARGADGRLTVVNGYHRLWAARRLGMTELPVRIVGAP
jgi:hypothetical protein